MLSLYSFLAVTVLSLWSILILSLLGANALQNPTVDKYVVVTLIALPSLLTFLVCKTVMVVYPDPPRDGQSTETKNKKLRRFQKRNAGSLIRWTATASGDDSPQGSVVLLLLSGTWLFHMLRALTTLLLITAGLVGWAVASSVDEAAEVLDSQTQNSTEVNPELLAAKQNLTMALHDLKNDIGIDFEHLLKRVSPEIIAMLMVFVWLLAFGLTGYIIAQAVSAFKKISTSPREAWTGVKEEDALMRDRKRIEVAPEVI